MLTLFECVSEWHLLQLCLHIYFLNELDIHINLALDFWNIDDNIPVTSYKCVNQNVKSSIKVTLWVSDCIYLVKYDISIALSEGL
jgi:hypothetical protein